MMDFELLFLQRLKPQAQDGVVLGSTEHQGEKPLSFCVGVSILPFC